MIQEIGKHRVTDHCITSGTIDKMMAGVTARVFYSDPPWGDGNLKYWATLNERMSGRSFAALTYTELLDRIRDLIRKYVNGHVFLETGQRFVDRAVSDMNPVIGGIKTFRIKYRSGSRFVENYLIYGLTHGSPPLSFDYSPEGMTGFSVVESCILAASAPGEIVFDPCCGMGYSARAAVNAGMRFYGNEFNPKRLEKTIEFLRSRS